MQTLFEVSFEVCNKVGGIHTVLASKSAYMQAQYPTYYLVGPYFESSAKREFIEEPKPAVLNAVCARLPFRVHYGTWLIASEPKVLLLEFSSLVSNADSFKADLFTHFGVDSLQAGYDYTEPLIFSLACAKFIEAYAQSVPQEQLVCHAHEWMCGFTNLYLRLHAPHVATVFTTHATILGRSLTSAGVPIESVTNPHDAAVHHGVLEKFSAEKACAKYSHVFTTVSQITANEAQHLLGVKADELVYNGLDFRMMKQQNVREKLLSFVRYAFMPYQQIDVSQTRFFFTSGRYEFSNKGFDTFIESLAKLNGSLQNSHKKVFAFFLVPAAHGSVQPLLLWSRLQYQKIMGDLTQSLLTHASKVFDTYVSRESVPQFTLPGSLHAHLRSFTQEGLPVSATHAVDPQTDILRLAHARGLTNKASDAVKLVFVPAYITGLDGIFDVPYYDLTGAMDLGVFASRYEPWGYTPLEANAVGVPTVTTNAAGYGQYCEERKLGGVNVLDRAKSESEVVARLHELLLDYATCDEEVLLERKELALLSAKTCDWKQFVGSYFRAHMLACERMKHDISKT